MAKMEQKPKANPLPFWSILANFFKFSTTVKKQTLHALESFSTTLNVFKAFLTCFQRVEKEAKIEQKVKANPLPFWSILATFVTF